MERLNGLLHQFIERGGPLMLAEMLSPGLHEECFQIARREGRRVRLRVNSADASVNGQPVTLDVPAQLYGGRILVPLRFVGEAMGADVKWMEATQTVNIQLGGAAPLPAVNPAPPVAPTPAEAAGPDGPTLFVQNCGNCHRIGDLGRGTISLAHIGAQRPRDWIEVQIRSPEQHHSNMPAFPPGRLSDRDLRVLSRYLADLK